MSLGQPSSNSSRDSLRGSPSVKSPNLPGSSAPFYRQPPLFSQQTLSRHVEGSIASDENSDLLNKIAGQDRQESEKQNRVDKIDTQWEEMLSTLAQVELSVANGMHMFSAEHEKALEGLRKAQIELAKAWARSDTEEAVEVADNMGKQVPGRKIPIATEEKTAGTTVTGGSGRPKSAAGLPTVEEDNVNTHVSESDIILARKRREANDKYFQRVNNSVLDVVARLEAVASATRDVERESRDIWGDCEVESSKTTVNHYERDLQD